MSNDTIHIRLADCMVPLFVGIYDHEKPRPQPVMITVEAIAPLTQRYDDFKSSSMASVISYEKLFNYLTTELPKLGHVPLLESLAENIIAFCFEDPRIIEARVRLEKPEAFKGKAMPSIEMKRTRATGWVLVTGAARRIGRAIALHLAAKGYNLILHYNRSADEAAEVADEILDMGRQAVLVELDLSQSSLVAKLIPSLVKELGPIAALVNNASLFEPDARDPDGHLHMAINAEAPRLLSQGFAAQAAEGAAIVNILDGMPPESGLDAYNRSKAALQNYTLETARDFAPKIRVNGVAPGPVLPNSRQSEAHFAAQVASTPLQRRIMPDDIAHAVHFLLVSPAITGEILHVDGGKHLNN